jgi:hypothetical protein
VFTVNLHLFGILLVHKCHGGILTAAGGIEMVEVRSSLDRGLKILQTFERISLMSRKARHCILEFLRVFDSLGEWTGKYTTLFYTPPTDICSS